MYRSVDLVQFLQEDHRCILEGKEAGSRPKTAVFGGRSHHVWHKCNLEAFVDPSRTPFSRIILSDLALAASTVEIIV